MTNLRKIIGSENRPFLSKEDRQQSSRSKRHRYHEEGHHAYMKSLGGTEKAIVNVFQPVHYANHRLFGASNITRKMLILALMDEEVLNPEFVEELAETVQKRDDEYVYKNGIYLRK